MVNGTHSDDFEEFQTNVVAFLAGILSRTLSCSLFPDDFPNPTPSVDVPEYLPQP